MTVKHKDSRVLSISIKEEHWGVEGDGSQARGGEPTGDPTPQGCQGRQGEYSSRGELRPPQPEAQPSLEQSWKMEPARWEGGKQGRRRCGLVTGMWPL